jgi:predicted transcriptional regulator
MDLLGPLQLKIMNIFWANYAPFTAQEIADSLNGAGTKYASTTITTVLVSLLEKNLVNRTKLSHSFVYEAIDGSKRIYRIAVLRNLIDDVYNNDLQELYTNLTEIAEKPHASNHGQSG